MKKWILGVCVALWPLVVVAQGSMWHSIQSPLATVYFHEGHENQAKQLIHSLSQSQAAVATFIGKYPIHQTLVLEDAGIVTNGFANPVTSKMSLLLNPPTSYSELQTYQDWWRLLVTHESTHMSHFEVSSEPASYLQDIFGHFFSPNLVAPYWWFEGLAVYQESQNSPYEGRLNDPYFAQLLDAKARAGQFPTLSQMSYANFTYPYNGQYVYGSLFVQYLCQTYGQEKVAKVLDHYGSNILAFLGGGWFPFVTIDASFKKVLGKNLDQLHAEWKASVMAQLESTSETAFSSAPMRYQFLTPYQDQVLAFVTEYRHNQPLLTAPVYSLVLFASPTQSRLVKRLTTAVASPIAIDGDVAYLGLEQVKGGYANRSYSGFGVLQSIHRLSLETGEMIPVLEGDFLSFCVINKTMIVAKPRQGSFGCELWRYRLDTQEKEGLGIVPFWVTEMCRFNDRLFCIAKTDRDAFALYEVTLGTLEFTPLVQTSYPISRLSRKGDSLYFCTHDGKKSGVYAYSLGSKKVQQFSQPTGYPTFPAGTQDRLFWVSETANGQQLNVVVAPVSVVASLPSVTPNTGSKEVSVNASFGADGISKSLETHLQWPQLRWLSFFNEDPLQTLTYSAFLNGEGVSAKVSTKWLSPASLFYLYETNREGANHWLGTAYPFWVSKLPGLTRFDGGLLYNLSDKFIPYVQSHFQWEHQVASLTLASNLSKGQSAWEGTHTLNLSPAYALTQRASFYALAYPFSFVTKPYFPENLRRDDRFFYECELSTSLFQIRNGLWNPNIFLGDVMGTVFVDYSTVRDGFLAPGAEIGVEGGSYFATTFYLKMGLVGYKSDPTVYLTFILK